MKPIFQKRHYEVIAEGFRGRPEYKWLAIYFVEVFRKDNPKFNEDKFWRAINGN